MKKLLLAFNFLPLLFLSPSYAQETESDFKPSAGSVSTELNVNPFNGEINFNNSVNQIKLRYFSSENLALRIGLNIKNQKDLTDYNYPYGSAPIRNKNEKSSTTLGLNFGIEKHFKGSKRVSPYIGIDIAIENHSAKQERINGQVTYNLKNAWYNTEIIQIPNYPYTSTVNTPGNFAYFSYGVNILTGFDFYIAKNFFFGYEFNLGFSNKSYKKPEETISGGNNNNPNNNYDYDNTSFSFGPKLLNGIRLGYNF